MNDSNPSAQSATPSDAATRPKPDNAIRLLLWLRPAFGFLIALVLGLWILWLIDRTISANGPSQIPETVLKEKNPLPSAPTNGTPALLEVETHSQAPRVWALGLTLTAEVSALALVLLAAAKIAREE